MVKILKILGDVKGFLIDTSFSIALIGGGILILMYAVGHKDAAKWLATLIVLYALVQYILV